MKKNTRGIIDISSTTEICCNCVHFVQHYIKSKDPMSSWFTALPSGHCVHPNIKDRYIDETCKNFELGEKAEYVKHMERFWEKYPELRR